jgi:hypothetical protein
VTQILFSDISSDAQLAALKPYVKLGDSYVVVAARLNQNVAAAQQTLRRPTYYSIGLDGVNLELALRTDGTVAGIGRYIHGQEKNGPVWLAGHGEKWWVLAAK